MKIAVAKYKVQAPDSFAAFARHQHEILGEAAAAGARVAVLPEYLALELAACLAADARSDMARSLAAIQCWRGDWLRLFSGLAREYRMHVLAGSFLLDVADTEPGAPRYRNRADLFTAEGTHLWQDKLFLTGFEKAAGMIEPGDVLKVFELDGIRTGIAVCYDCEFPLTVRARREAGMRLLLVPSCTDTAAGATRVRTGCLARALENRCAVAQAVTAGEAQWSPALDVNTGEAGIYLPMDCGFPPDGVLAQTRDDACWALGEVDFSAFEATRSAAQVGIDLDWPMRQCRDNTGSRMPWRCSSSTIGVIAAMRASIRARA